jgi:hypothetical protein
MTELERARAHLKTSHANLAWRRQKHSRCPNLIKDCENQYLAALSWVWDEQENLRMREAAEILKRLNGAYTERRLPEGGDLPPFRWQRVNHESFEYAIQQGPFGDEFVKLVGGSCLRRPINERPVTSPNKVE